MTINATRVAFEKRVREIQFVRDELLKRNPRFTLEWNEEEDRYKYIFIDAMFKLFEPMYQKLVDVGAEHVIKTLDVFTMTVPDNCEAIPVLTSATESIQIQIPRPFCEEIFKIADKLGKIEMEADRIYVRVSTCQAIHMDRWAPFPEAGRQMHFFTRDDADEFIRLYNREYNNLRTTPDEYTTHESRPDRRIKIEDLELCEYAFPQKKITWLRVKV